MTRVTQETRIRENRRDRRVRRYIAFERPHGIAQPSVIISSTALPRDVSLRCLQRQRMRRDIRETRVVIECRLR